MDSIKLASAIDRQAEKYQKVQSVLIQVNISGESSKSGIKREAAAALIRNISKFDNIAVKGLMTIPQYYNDPENARPFFAALSDLCNEIRNEAIPGINMGELSMGMSGDYGVAIEEGATLIRVGTSIFGDRK